MFPKKMFRPRYPKSDCGAALARDGKEETRSIASQTLKRRAARACPEPTVYCCECTDRIRRPTSPGSALCRRRPQRAVMRRPDPLSRHSSPCLQCSEVPVSANNGRMIAILAIRMLATRPNPPAWRPLLIDRERSWKGRRTLMPPILILDRERPTVFRFRIGAKRRTRPAPTHVSSSSQCRWRLRLLGSFMRRKHVFSKKTAIRLWEVS